MIAFRDLLFANVATPLESVLEGGPISVSRGTDQEECSRLMQRYHLEALPIADKSNKLLGFIDLTDVLDVAEEEATEDMHHIVGLTGHESISS
jgi:magnesium transporter